MNAHIAPLLQQLIDAGRRPKTDEDFRAQEQVGGKVVLFNPPFLTVWIHITYAHFWTSPEADPSGVDFDLTLVIGDHGLGDDVPILLDYRGNRPTPAC